MAANESPLASEMETFLQVLPQLLERHQGKYVLIHGKNVAGTWTTIDEALAQGYERFGVDAFLVKEIVEHEEPIYCSRNVRSCP